MEMAKTFFEESKASILYRNCNSFTICIYVIALHSTTTWTTEEISTRRKVSGYNISFWWKNTIESASCRKWRIRFWTSRYTCTIWPLGDWRTVGSTCGELGAICDCITIYCSVIWMPCHRSQFCPFELCGDLEFVEIKIVLWNVKIDFVGILPCGLCWWNLSQIVNFR